MSIQSEIDRLNSAKQSIAASLQKMGVSPPEGTTLDEYAAQLAAVAASAPFLPLSGGEISGELFVSGAGEDGSKIILEKNNFNGLPLLTVGFLGAPGATIVSNLDSLYAAGLVSPDWNISTAVGMMVLGPTFAKAIGVPEGITMKGPINFGGSKLALVGDPVSSTDAATKGYVDSLADMSGVEAVLAAM